MMALSEKIERSKWLLPILLILAIIAISRIDTPNTELITLGGMDVGTRAK